MNARAGLRLLTTVALAGGLLATATGTSSATTPGGNGLITFESTRNGASDIYVKAADGAGVRRLTSSVSAEVDPAWSPDGRRIAYAGDGTSEGVVTYDAATRRATLNPNANLARGTRYTVTLTGGATGSGTWPATRSPRPAGASRRSPERSRDRAGSRPR